jgi:uncharacterized protein YebE (UPF0316 family)
VDLSDLLIPLLIFVSEVCVVTLGTLRIIFIARGHKYIAPALGFFEVLIWLFAMKNIMENLGVWMCFIAFALGFTLGNWLGILIEKALALGTVIVRIITHRDPAILIERLRAADFGVTCVEASGATGKVQIVMTVVKRKRLPEITAMIEEYHPGAFYAVDDLQSTSEGIFPGPKERPGIIPLPFAKLMRFLVPDRAPEAGSVCETRCSD